MTMYHGNVWRGGDSVTGHPHKYLYNLWTMVRHRCTNPNFHSWKHYGGRGIRMHPPWVEDYEAFKVYILSEVGERPSTKHSMDRIDNDGHYEPGNLRWATKREQTLNRRGRATDSNVYPDGRGTWLVSRQGITKDQAIAYRDAGERAIAAKELTA